MIEIDYEQREQFCGVHRLRIWLNGNLSCARELFTVNELKQLRDALHNEYLALDKYLYIKGWDKEMTND